MPSKNRIKEFGAGEFYHVYNRGVEKRSIFLDRQDYLVFMNLLKKYLLPVEMMDINNRRANYFEKIELNAFCLMPNHFHFLLRQHSDRDVTQFMRSLISSYVAYFNRRHNRVGSLFQDIYKAVRIESNEQLYQVVQYIHLNPINLVENASDYPYSSFGNENQLAWISPVPTGYDPARGRTLQSLSGVEGAKAL